MSAYKTGSAEQAEMIARRLLCEPLFASPTASEVVAGIEADDDAALERMYDYIERLFRARTYGEEVEHQNRATIRMWMELNGDLPPSRYTEEHAYALQDALRCPPAMERAGMS